MDLSYGGESDSSSIIYGVNKLSDFSSVLTSCLKNVDRNVTRLNSKTQSTAESVFKIKEDIVGHDHSIKALEDEVYKQRLKLDTTSKIAIELRETLGNQINEFTVKVNRDMLVQRSGAKLDINTLRSQLTKSIADVVSELNQHSSVKFLGISHVIDRDTMSTSDISDVLINRVDRLEKMMNIQDNLDRLMSKTFESDGELFNNVDALHAKIIRLEDELANKTDEIEDMKRQQHEAKHEVSSSLMPTQEKIKDYISNIIFNEYSTRNLRIIHRRPKRAGTGAGTGGGGGGGASPVLHSNSNSNNPDVMSLAAPGTVPVPGTGPGDAEGLGPVQVVGHHYSLHSNGHSTLSPALRHTNYVHKHALPASPGTGLGTVSGDSEPGAGPGSGSGLGFVENFINAYTVDESDMLADRVQELESTLLHVNIGSLRTTVTKLSESLAVLQKENEIQRIALGNLKAQLHGSGAGTGNGSGESYEAGQAKRMVRQIAVLRNEWNVIREDLDFSLGYLTEENEKKEMRSIQSSLGVGSGSGSGGSVGTVGGGSTGSGSGTGDNNLLDDDNEDFKLSVNTDPLISLAEEFLALMEGSMADFNPRTFNKEGEGREHAALLFPALDKLTLRAARLLALDDERQLENGAHVLGDFVCLDHMHSIRRKLEDAVKHSMPVLDASVDKITMRRRVEKLEVLVNKKIDRTHVLDLEQELKHIIGRKANQDEMLAISVKKASVAELHQLKSMLLGKGSSEGGGWRGFPGMLQDGADDGAGPEPGEGGSGGRGSASSSEILELTKRFEYLSRHLSDLQTQCSAYVPRQEVHEAVKAILGEVKSVKNSTVTRQIFKDGLKLKADMEEFNKLVSTLTFAIGDREASAVHAKCLVCDKPVSSVAGPVLTLPSPGTGPGHGPGPLSSRPRSPKTQTHTQSSNQNQHMTEDTATRMPSSSFQRLRSADPKISSREKAKVSVDIAVLKSTVDLPLPAISGASGEGNNSVNGSTTYKQRIRSAAGGGIAL